MLTKLCLHNGLDISSEQKQNCSDNNRKAPTVGQGNKIIAH